MSEQSLRFRIGVFVLAALILLAVLTVLFNGMPTILKRHEDYTVWFDNAPGVAPGTPVRRSGVRIGQVTSVQLDDATGRVRVVLSIDAGHPMYEDDMPTVVRGPLGSDTTIDLLTRPPATPPPPTDGQSGKIIPAAFGPLAQAQPPANPPPVRRPAKPGTEFQGATQADVTAVLKDLSTLTGPAMDAFREMRSTLERYERMTPLMEETMREYRDLARATRAMVPELRQTNAEVQALTHSVNDIMPELRRTNAEIQVTAQNWGRLGEELNVLLQTNEDKLVRTLDSLNEVLIRMGSVFNEENQRNLTATLRNVNAGSQNLESISRNTDELLKDSRQTIQRINNSLAQSDEILGNLQRATQPMAERSASVMKNLDESSEKLNRGLTDVRALLRAFGQGDGTLQRVLNDPALYNNLNDAACMLVRIMPRLDRALKDVEVFADKIARHPESLGVGGAVRPSSGLKEAPTSNMHFPDH
jgi:ABC-type transporter Mla subunit MlaD